MFHDSIIFRVLNAVVQDLAAHEGMGLISVINWSFSHHLPREQAIEYLGWLEIQVFILIATSWFGLFRGQQNHVLGVEWHEFCSSLYSLLHACG